MKIWSWRDFLNVCAWNFLFRFLQDLLTHKLANLPLVIAAQKNRPPHRQPCLPWPAHNKPFSCRPSTSAIYARRNPSSALPVPPPAMSWTELIWRKFGNLPNGSRCVDSRSVSRRRKSARPSVLRRDRRTVRAPFAGKLINVQFYLVSIVNFNELIV